jgi:hypothetical protein
VIPDFNESVACRLRKGEAGVKIINAAMLACAGPFVDLLYDLLQGTNARSLMLLTHGSKWPISLRRSEGSGSVGSPAISDFAL